MQRLKNSYGPGMAHEMEPTPDAGAVPRQTDESKLTMASVTQAVSDEQFPGVRAFGNNVGVHTAFTGAYIPKLKIHYLAAGIFASVAVFITVTIISSSHTASPSVGHLPRVIIAKPVADDIVREVVTSDNLREVEAPGLTPAESPVMTATEAADLSASSTTSPERENSEEHRPVDQDISLSVASTTTAEKSPEYAKKTSVPVPAPVHEPDQDKYIAAMINDITENDVGEINIIRKRVPDQTAAIVNAAYAAFTAGDFSAAQQAWLEVLEIKNNHRDALLGMAAIAMRTGRADEALRIWLKILQHDPDDPVAQSAVIDHMASHDYQVSVQILSTLLNDNPQDAFLYFSLGNLHARASRWPLAQQAFSEAFRLEGNNPDYAFNLAVCLEHMRDQGAALKYYNIALELSQNQSVRFSDSVVQARITALAKSSHAY